MGPGLSVENYKNCDYPTSIGAPEHNARWSYKLVGIDFGLGNEWRSSSGLMGGCEWVGVFWGRLVKSDGNEYRDGSKMPKAVLPRVLACYMGASF